MSMYFREALSRIRPNLYYKANKVEA